MQAPLRDRCRKREQRPGEHDRAVAPRHGLERAPALRLCGREGLGVVLAGYACALANQAAWLDTATQQSTCLHLCNLAALTLGANSSVRETRYLTYRAAQRQRIATYIEAHFHEHNLSAARAACELGMSRRWLHALLERGGASFSTRLVQRRLEACTKLLANPTYGRLPITEIALRCGFNRFRARYDTALRDFRRAHRPVT